jgi:frataxin-like iron-binding protein CyaY
MAMEYPWIVGLRYTQRPPVDWQLWAANVVTGHHFLLDHGLGWKAKIERQFPDFALNHHRVI